MQPSPEAGVASAHACVVATPPDDTTSLTILVYTVTGDAVPSLCQLGRAVIFQVPFVSVVEN